MIFLKHGLQVRLYKVEENKRFWVFFFRDAVNLLGQAVIMPKEASWEGMEDAWERMHMGFQEHLEKKIWD